MASVQVLNAETGESRYLSPAEKDDLAARFFRYAIKLARTKSRHYSPDLADEFESAALYSLALAVRFYRVGAGLSFKNYLIRMTLRQFDKVTGKRFGYRETSIRRRVQLLTESDTGPHPFRAVVDRPPAVYQSREDFGRRLEEIGVPAAHREAITLRFYDGLTVEQAAGRLGVSYKAFWWRMKRMFQNINAVYTERS